MTRERAISIGPLLCVVGGSRRSVILPAVAATLFPFRIDSGLRPILLFFGVRRSSAWTRLDDDRMVTRFGFFSVDIPLTDIEWWDITGPYKWYRAVGVRQTIPKPEISFGSTAVGGLRVHLRTRHRVAWVRALDFYVTVEDLEGLGAALAARGIPGSDKRLPRASG
jgi:hypothetical protein